jgi:beta-mannosidase
MGELVPSAAMGKASQRVVIPLHENWHFADATDGSAWLPVSQFPTNVHLDLLHHGKIPDPYRDQNESLVQWVGEKVWIYRTEFDVPETSQKTILSFEGLDTYATVVVNGHEVLKSDNMFISHRVDVTEIVKFGTKNSLEMTFDSAWIEGKKLQEKYPDHAWGCWNGDASRLAVRKAQYHYVNLVWSFQFCPF